MYKSDLIKEKKNNIQESHPTAENNTMYRNYLTYCSLNAFDLLLWNKRFPINLYFNHNCHVVLFKYWSTTCFRMHFILQHIKHCRLTGVQRQRGKMALTWGRRCRTESPLSVPTAMATRKESRRPYACGNRWMHGTIMMQVTEATLIMVTAPME